MRVIRTEGSNPSLSVSVFDSGIDQNPILKLNKEAMKQGTPLFYSSRPGLRPGSLDRNPKMKRETKNITTV